MRSVSGFQLLRLFLRSFLVQTGFTYERLIGFGFAWILLPLAGRLFRSEQERNLFLKRHLASFNANPYLVGYAVGAAARLEEAKAPTEQIVRFKESVRGPLGALGDNLIWQNLRPALLLFGLALTGAFGVYGLLVVWLAFNLYQTYLRGRGVLKGYVLGTAVFSDLAKGHLQQVARWSSRAGALLAGMLFVLLLAAPTGSSQLGRWAFQPAGSGLALLFVVLSFAAFRRSVNPGYLLIIFIVLLLALNLIIGAV